jgi:glycosyltransferase involved in cell wall biosynthesis
MRVLMLSTISPQRDGLYARPYYMAKHLRRMPIELRLVAFDSEVAGFTPGEVVSLPLSYYVKFGSLPSIHLFTMFLRGLVRRLKPDLIYAHQPTNILAAVLARTGKLQHLPIVGDFHGLASIEMTAWGNPFTAQIFRCIEGLCVHASVALTVASEDIKQQLMRRRYPGDRIHVIRNCVDISEFFPIRDKSNLKQRLGLPASKKIVAFTAPRTFTPNIMAINMLYRVASILERRSPEILFLILGGGKIPSGRRPGNVEYTGFVEDLNLYLNACDLAVAPYPSGAICGGSRNKVLEYWACGLPLISTPEGLRGFKVPQGPPAVVTSYDPEGISCAIETVVRDEKLARELGEEARVLVHTEYNWEREARRLYDVIKSSALMY